MTKVRVAFKVFYDGRYFEGFQRQPNGKGVENLLIDTLVQEGILEDLREARWSYASRTDKGVSARGQVIAFDLDYELLPLIKNLMRINKHLIPKACLWAHTVVRHDFHPRKEANLRHYKYVIPKFIFEKINVEMLRKAAYLISGEYNFRAIAKSPYGHEVRRIKVWIEESDYAVILNFASRGFYRRLIRNLVTLMVKVSLDEFSLDELKLLLLGKRSIEEGIAPAPPEGLILWDVKYPSISFKVDHASLLRLNQYLKTSVQKMIFPGVMLYYVKRGLEGILDSRI